MTVINNQPCNIDDIDFAAVTDTAKLPQPVSPPIKQAVFKQKTEDFIVNESLDLEFTDAGEHLWLHMQKSGMNTAFLAKLLSEWADIPLRDVGYSGLKDRHALTTQWFSLRIPRKILPATIFAPTNLSDHESVQLLAQHWHNKKLNRGTHNANRFVITLREIQFVDDQMLADSKALVEQHLQHISQSGVPNYFGSQRFGFGGNNIKAALNLFARALPNKTSNHEYSKKKNKRKGASREQNSMELSAARSSIFNEILAARVRNGSWDKGLNGEVFNLNGSSSIFASEQMDETLHARLASGDIHSTGVLWGTGNDKVSGLAADLENEVVQGNELLSQLAIGLEQRDIKAQRRALRLPVEELSWDWRDEQTLVLSFTLTTGSFATSVLASLIQELQMPSLA